MTPGSRPTLRDVARLAGLSVTQTSRALNGHSDVAAATRQRAEVAAQELGYVPNLAARRLKMPDTRAHSIGLVLVSSQRFSDPFLGDLLTAMADEAAAQGYELQLSAPLADEPPTTSYDRAIRGKRVDGFVLLRATLDDSRAQFLAQRSFPFVTFGRVDGVPEARAVAEAADCLQPAVSHLVELGHRRIGCLVEPLEYSIGAGRYHSFRLAMATCGLEVDDDLVIHSGFHSDTAYQAAGAALDGPDPPTALVASNDLLALGAMRAATARGLTVPDQLSVVGFDDITAAQFTAPPLTTLRYPDRTIGHHLITQLLAVIDDPGGGADVFIRPDLVLRHTTAPPP